MEEGVEPSRQRGDDIAVALVLSLELGEQGDDVMSGGVVGPELGGEA